MPDSTLTPEQVAALAGAPTTVSTDGLSVTERPADEVIALDRYAAEKQAAAASAAGRPKSAWGSLRPAIAVPPGAS